MSKNLCSKTRDVSNPYEIWVAMVTMPGEEPVEFEYRVLKKWQTPENEVNNPYARWYCATKSPYTFGSWEYGDSYVKDITGNPTARMIKGDMDLRKVMRHDVDKKNVF